MCGDGRRRATSATVLEDHERRPDIEIWTAVLLSAEKSVRARIRFRRRSSGLVAPFMVPGKFQPRLCRHAGTIVNAGTDLIFGRRPRSDRVLFTCFVRRFTREPWVRMWSGAWSCARCVAPMRESGSSQSHSPNAGDIVGSEHHAVHVGGGEEVFFDFGQSRRVRDTNGLTDCWSRTRRDGARLKDGQRWDTDLGTVYSRNYSPYDRNHSRAE